MAMSHVYQPVMIRTILEGGGAATRRQIAAAFSAADLSQLEYYENVVSRYPGPVLRRRGIVEHEKGVYRLGGDLRRMDEWQRAMLIALCDAKVADYVSRRQSTIWAHRSANADPVPGTLRYQVIARAMRRCEACGISNELSTLEADHIIPRSKGGSNDLSNLQALCSLCNVQKLNRDQTDFREAHQEVLRKQPGCEVCEKGVLAEEGLVLSLEQDGRRLIAPRRHGVTWLGLWQPEVNALRRLEQSSAIEAASSFCGSMQGTSDSDPGHLVISYSL